MLPFGPLTDASMRLPHHPHSVGVYTRRPNSEPVAGAAYASTEFEDVCVYACRFKLSLIKLFTLFFFPFCRAYEIYDDQND